MIYLVNYCFLNLIKVLNIFGRGLTLKKRISSSQHILERNFEINSDFSFIQIGANDGISFDFLYDFVTKRNSSGIVVEPIEQYFKELVNNYSKFSNILPINKAVHPLRKQVVVYKINENEKNNYPDWVKGIASLDSNHHKKTNIKTEHIVEEIVTADTLMNIIDTNYQSNKVDYFQIDTEGFDYEILKMLNFNKLKPEIIKYESVNLSIDKKKNSELLLKQQGYYTFNESGDTIGVNLSKIKIF